MLKSRNIQIPALDPLDHIVAVEMLRRKSRAIQMPDLYHLFPVMAVLRCCARAVRLHPDIQAGSD